MKVRENLNRKKTDLTNDLYQFIINVMIIINLFFLTLKVLCLNKVLLKPQETWATLYVKWKYSSLRGKKHSLHDKFIGFHEIFSLWRQLHQEALTKYIMSRTLRYNSLLS